MSEISIIIPVYNSEEYLPACLDSVLDQVFRDFELILVDDGSPDECGRICDEYAAKDNRIKVYHIENSGSSAARNYGLDRARGRYIGFIDSDDYIDRDMYRVLYNNIEREDADISMCGLADVYGERVLNPVDEPIFKVMDAEESIRTVMEAKLTSVTPVNKLYKRELFEGIRYPVGEDSGEDASIIVDILLRCKKAVLTTEQLYYYIHREGSITTRDFRLSDKSVIRAYKKNYKLIKEHMPSLIPVARMRICWAYFFVLDKLLISPNRKDFKAEEKELVRFLRKHFRFIVQEKRFNLTRRLAMFLLRINTELYRCCVLWIKKSRELA